MAEKEATRRRVRLLGKPDCELCDDAKTVLQSARRQIPFVLEEIDIESDPDLARRYAWDIPIIELDGQEIARHRILLSDLLDALKR